MYPEAFLFVVSSAPISARGCHTVTAEWETEGRDCVCSYSPLYHGFNQALPHWKTLQLMTSYSQFKTDLN